MTYDQLDDLLRDDLRSMGLMDARRPRLTLPPLFTQDYLLLIEHAARRRHDLTPLPGRFRSWPARLESLLLLADHGGRIWRRYCPKSRATNVHAVERAPYFLKFQIRPTWLSPESTKVACWREAIGIGGAMHPRDFFLVLRRARDLEILSEESFEAVGNDTAWRTVVRNAWCGWHSRAVCTKIYRTIGVVPKPHREDLIALISVESAKGYLTVPRQHQQRIFSQMLADDADWMLKLHARNSLVGEEGNLQWQTFGAPSGLLIDGR